MRTRILLALCCTLFALPTLAQQQPNTLTPKEIEDGWILLFDGSTTYGLMPNTGRSDAWATNDGYLSLTGGSGLHSTAEFGDFELTAECWCDRAGGATIGFRRDNQEAEDLQPQTKTPLSAVYSRSSLPANRWTIVRISKEGLKETVEFGGKRSREKLLPIFSRCQIAFSSIHGAEARFRNIKLRPLGLKSIFNGKDLTGWNPVPDHKSVFTVTPESWLNIKNGNGDIQTDGEWGDFVLQLDVYSNGDHLNSGVFFRANKGKFWSGYEDQIRNQWQDDDRTKAVDYGTGGIYNRLPARKVVSSDREWFTMTLVAHGLHIASWVNGYLVADFTDTRPPDETNARNGARTAPGVISLQGHDPTTDLSFRNIRVVELPK